MHCKILEKLLYRIFGFFGGAKVARRDLTYVYKHLPSTEFLANKVLVQIFRYDNHKQFPASLSVFVFNIFFKLQGIMPTAGSRRSSHAIKQLSVTRDESFEEEEMSDEEEVRNIIIRFRDDKSCTRRIVRYPLANPAS